MEYELGDVIASGNMSCGKVQFIIGVAEDLFENEIIVLSGDVIGVGLGK